MTVVLVALTERYIVQASDRRVVIEYRRGSRLIGRKLQDGHVKAITTRWFGCAYAGIADLGPTGDTADWIATYLSDHTEDPDGGIYSIGEATRRALSSRRLPTSPHALGFAAWHLVDEVVVPYLLVVSNHRPNSPEEEFETIEYMLPKGAGAAVVSVGVLPIKNEVTTVERQIRRLVETKRDTPRVIAQLLTETIRSIAQPGKHAFSWQRERAQYVSEDVLLYSHPRPDLLAGWYVVGKLVEDWISVTHIPAGKSRLERPAGPIMVGPKAAIQTAEVTGEGVISGMIHPGFVGGSVRWRPTLPCCLY